MIFGPKPRDYSYKLPKKVRRLAMRSALSAKVKEGNLIVLEDLKLTRPRTKDMLGILKALNLEDRKALVVTAEPDKNVELSARNIPGVTPMASRGLNVYDILAHEKLVITREAVERVQEVLA